MMRPWGSRLLGGSNLCKLTDVGTGPGAGAGETSKGGLSGYVTVVVGGTQDSRTALGVGDCSASG